VGKFRDPEGGKNNELLGYLHCLVDGPLCVSASDLHGFTPTSGAGPEAAEDNVGE